MLFSKYLISNFVVTLLVWDSLFLFLFSPHHWEFNQWKLMTWKKIGLEFQLKCGQLKNCKQVRNN